MAKTQLEFNLVAVERLEAEWGVFNKIQEPNSSQTTGVIQELYYNAKSTLERKEHEAMTRSNDRVGLIQAEAKGHATILMSEPLMAPYRTRLPGLMSELTQTHVFSSESVRRRIAVFEEKQPEVVTLLIELDELIAAEIAKPL